MKTGKLDTGTDELLAELDHAVLLVTLNRPKARNALSDTLTPALREVVRRAADAPEVRCLVVTGAGTAFCAGGDVKGMGGGSRRAPRTEADAIGDLTVRQETLTAVLYELPFPTIAALPGPAAGAGLSIALACDLRIAADTAFVTTGFANVGLAGDYGASFFLSHLVGTAKARELFYTAERVDARSCLALGIVNQVVPPEDLMQTTLALARRLAAGPTRAYAYMKRNLDRALREDLRTCLAHEAEGTVKSAQTDDHREAVRAFIDKRTPLFRGR